VATDEVVEPIACPAQLRLARLWYRGKLTNFQSSVVRLATRDDRTHVEKSVCTARACATIKSVAGERKRHRVRAVAEALAEAAAGGTELDLKGQRLTEIPQEIFGMTHLTLVDLSDNALTELPPEIGNLSNLWSLSLRQNSLQHLPPELGSLAKLMFLDLSFNQLVEVPPEIAQLSSLASLNIFHNQLTTLPDELWGIRTTAGGGLGLHVGANLLERISPAIANSSIRYFESIGNQLTSLPVELGQLSDDITLSLEGNPLDEPFPALIEQGTRALLAYLRSLGDGVKLYEAKVLLVGEGNVGKSSLVAALKGGTFEEQRSTTHGIEIGEVRVPHPSEPVEITLKTWDFGGQDVYRVTHQFFFSRRCLYLLVWWPREGTETGDIEGWCRRIRLRIGPEARILLVATHADDRRAEMDYPELQREFGEMLVGSVAVDNASGTGIDELRSLIAEKVAELPQMGERISRSWISARDEILARREEATHIPYDDFVAACERHELDGPATTTLAGLMHDLGQVIHYDDDDGLRDVVILQPEWLTKAISYVLDDRSAAQDGGLLEHARLRDIWNDPDRDTRYPAEVHPYFLRLMEKFDVSYRIPDSERSLVAQLVPFERPELPWDTADQLPEGERALSLVFRPNEVAPGLVPWMTVRNHRFSVGKHWRRGMFLEHRPHHAEALIELGRRDLTLTVRAPSPDYFFAILRDSLEDLARRRWNGLTYELVIPCPTIACDGSFEITDLERYRERHISEIRCHRCLAEHDITMLLTGFVQPETEMTRVAHEVRVLAGEVREAHRSSATWSAELASGIRSLLAAAASEGADCPRLFTLVARDPSGWQRIWIGKQPFALTLWCEHPGEEHPWAPAAYEFERPKEWLAQIAPYALAVSRLLRLAVPIGAAALGTFMSEAEFKEMEKQLGLMKALVEKLPEDVPPHGDRPVADGRLNRAVGGEARVLRALLLELDPPQALGGLRRVVAPSGEYLWVCPQVHYRAYDPGLPQLPG
jgi:GTPase SAR1 family protein